MNWRPTLKFTEAHGLMSAEDFHKTRLRHSVNPTIVGKRNETVVARADVNYTRPDNVPFARGSKFEPGAPTEHRWTEGGKAAGFHTRVKGVQMLTPVSTGANGLVTTVGVGKRLPGGTQVISPEALGGRLEVLASQYEYHAFTHLKVYYKTVVDAATPGALLIYYRQDVGVPTDEIGMTELEHASTHYGNVVQTPVWQDCEHTFEIMDMMNMYSDATDDAYMSAQGVLFVESASVLAANTTYGNLYIEYECEFYGAEAEYSIGELWDGTAVFTCNAFSTVAGEPVTTPFLSGGPSAGNSGMSLTNAPSSSNYILYGEVIGTTGTLPTYFSGDEARSSGFDVGSTFWISVETNGPATDYTDGSLVAILYNDYASAGALAYHAAHGGDLSEEGVMRWNATGPSTGTFTMALKSVPVKTT